MLKVEHVSYRYPNGERDVLQDVCCTLEDGQLSAIVGPSGSGKTTLLSILAGLDSPAEGSVSIDGEDYKSLDLDRCRRERIAMIFQAFHLFPLLNVVENVCFAMELNGVAKSKAVGPAKELLEMEDGQLSAIVGPSGSGKTTLLSILAGLDSPAEGSVSIDGEDYKSLDLDRCRRERIAMIFQAFHLFPLLNVVENVCFAMELNGVAKSKAVGPAKELLEMVGIGEEKHKRYPAHLSGGEQQRVAIARALASGARVILADEPTGNLDTANGDRVMEILQRLAHEEGYCVVVVTHDMSIAEAADQVLRMKDGVLAEQETA